LTATQKIAGGAIASDPASVTFTITVT
jgi:hypothetical protein